jgi:hypothetical protein
MEAPDAAAASAAEGPGEEGAVRLDRWARVSPLSGVVFLGLVIVGGFVLIGSTPGAKASPAHVIAFYTAHRARDRAGAVVITFAFIAFFAFAISLRNRWRRRPKLEGLSTGLLAAATVLLAGQTASAGIIYTLTDNPRRLTASSAQTLNLLQNDLVLTSAAGFFCFLTIAAIVVLRGRVLPLWLGWLALITAILFVTPLEFVGFVLLLVWTAAVSLLAQRAS